MIIEITRENDRPPRSIIAPSAEIRAEYEAKCQSCGLCCCHPLTKADGPITGNSEFTHWSSESVTYRWWHGEEITDTQTGFWMRRTWDGKCIALEGALGEKVKCSIYEDRPSVCRQFEAGSEACLHLREKARKT